MGYSDQFFKALHLDGSKKALQTFSKLTGVPVKKLRYYNDNNVLPSGAELTSILETSGVSESYIKLMMGRIDKCLLDAIQNNVEKISELVDEFSSDDEQGSNSIETVYTTKLGKLFQGDCLDAFPLIEDDSVDLVFADPPFNLNKLYPSNIDDNLKKESYIRWSEKWLSECVRILKPGGSLFIWNLPKWNAILGNYLDGYLTFRNWIAVDMKYSLPIQNRLYPSHYSLLYYIKGDKANTFHPDRTPMQTCPKCFHEIKDYGGYKDKMNPKGINLTDIWLDIPPVRHAKYKRREGANELSLKLLDRIIEMATNEGDVVFDPFGGSGTTYMAAELKNRRWLGCEVGPVDVIVDRFKKIEQEREIINAYRGKVNLLFTDDILKERKKRQLWTPDSVKKKNKNTQSTLFE